MMKELMERQKFFLSIIIPLYNPVFCEFKRCIDSMTGITIPHEIVVVDDGSDDDISYECENYIKDSAVIKFVKKENGGVSSARNFGIEKSCGKYILFLDADDEISTEFVEYLNNNCDKIVADWVLCGIKVKDIEKKKEFYRTIVEKDIFHSNEDIFNVDYGFVLQLRAESKELCECWAKFIKRDILKKYDVQFKTGMLSGEDALFNTCLMQHIVTIQCIPIYGYIYYYIPRLAPRVVDDPIKRWLYLFEGEKELENLIHEKCDTETAQKLIKEKKSITTVEIVQDCFILIKAKRLSANIRKGLFNVIDEYGLFDELDICDCTSVKRKLYYILLKEKRWTAMRAIVNLKQALKR